MITHEEARNLLNELVPTDAITPSQIDDLHDYIAQQQAKEERAKKVEELLELYHKLLKYIGLYNASTYCTKETLNDLEQKVKATQKQIDELENKINEMVGIEE